MVCVQYWCRCYWQLHDIHPIVPNKKYTKHSAICTGKDANKQNRVHFSPQLSHHLKTFLRDFNIDGGMNDIDGERGTSSVGANMFMIIMTFRKIKY